MRKFVVWSSAWDKKKKTFMPTFKVSPEFDTREEAQTYLDENFKDNATTKYGVFETSGNTGYY